MIIKRDKCLNYTEFETYIREFLYGPEMSLDEYISNLQAANHIKTCSHCSAIMDNVKKLIEEATSEEVFWKNFNEYWKKEETGAQGIKLCNVALKKGEIINKIKEFPEWLREKLSDNIDELFSIGFFKKEAVVGAVRGENASDNVDANNITISYKETNKGYTVMIGIYEDIKGKLYLEDDAGNIYEANKIEEGYMEFHNVPTEKFTIKYMV